ncbi:hypothetical protein [Anaerofustis stercorihominis]|uniref:portal protein n=1 Tax=Anaerofustis stercorihominis TaxID=214853 RepID=UPI0026737ABB|nr:hypothetical protein [Anaerofustis stercorihominis]
MEEMYSRTDEWTLYEKGKDFLSRKNIYSDTDKVYRFFNGNQWQGLESGVISPITYNIIKPIVKYKIGVINGNGYSIVFSPNNFEDERFQIEMTGLCEQLNEYINILWENKKIDAKAREILKDGCINSEGILYLDYDMTENEVNPEVINKTNIYYENENNPDINEQDYILITTRRSVSSVRREAKKNMEFGLNSLNKDDIDNIRGDNNTKEQSGDYAKEELNNMVLVVSKFFKKDGHIWFKKSTENAVIEDERDLGLSKYPIAHFVWEEVKGSARGTGEVLNLIPNQIEINKTATRRSLAVMMGAYPKLVVDGDRISNPDSITKVGNAIFTKGQTVDDVRKVVGYLNPASMSSDSVSLQNDLINNTKDLAGAGDSVTGDVNPEQASGQAILAVQQASQQNLTDYLIRFKDFLEDVASIIFEMWQVYTPDEGKAIITKQSVQGLKEDMGPQINMENINPYSADETGEGEDFDSKLISSKVGHGEVISSVEENDKDIEDKEVYIRKVIPKELIEKLKVNIKIDVSPNSPFDKYARETALQNLMTNQLITFEEYAENLPSDSVMPKDILTNILKKRKEEEAKINQIEMAAEEKKAEIDSNLAELPVQEGNVNPIGNDMTGQGQSEGEFYN